MKENSSKVLSCYDRGKKPSNYQDTSEYLQEIGILTTEEVNVEYQDNKKKEGKLVVTRNRAKSEEFLKKIQESYELEPIVSRKESWNKLKETSINKETGKITTDCQRIVTFQYINKSPRTWTQIGKYLYKTFGTRGSQKTILDMLQAAGIIYKEKGYYRPFTDWWRFINKDYRDFTLGHSNKLFDNIEKEISTDFFYENPDFYDQKLMFDKVLSHPLLQHDTQIKDTPNSQPFSHLMECLVEFKYINIVPEERGEGSREKKDEIFNIQMGHLKRFSKLCSGYKDFNYFLGHLRSYPELWKKYQQLKDDLFSYQDDILTTWTTMSKQFHDYLLTAKNTYMKRIKYIGPRVASAKRHPSSIDYLLGRSEKYTDEEKFILLVGEVVRKKVVEKNIFEEKYYYPDLIFYPLLNVRDEVITENNNNENGKAYLGISKYFVGDILKELGIQGREELKKRKIGFNDENGSLSGKFKVTTEMLRDFTNVVDSIYREYGIQTINHYHKYLSILHEVIEFNKKIDLLRERVDNSIPLMGKCELCKYPAL